MDEDGSWRRALPEAYDRAPWEAWASADPICLVRRYWNPRDREIAGFIAAALAYGRVASILSSVWQVLAPMSEGPRAFLEAFEARRDAERFRCCIHRFHTADAVVAMLEVVHLAIRRHGSLEALFRLGDDPAQPTIRDGLARFVDALRAMTEGVYGPSWERDLYGWRHFLASPDDGSACKRLNLYLRWMVRKGPPDLGVWRGVSPARLVIPVDVHVATLARAMGLTRRATADWRMAEEITAALRSLDPDDPIRFDFVISHTGMDGLTLGGSGTTDG